MVKVYVNTRSNEIKEIKATVGHSLMEAIRDAGISEMLALCGGCCSCATCHVYVEEAFVDRVMPISETESGLLQSSDHRTCLSRLSCQLEVTEAYDGVSVTLAPED